MRHRKKGRVLGRKPAHRKALFRNMVSALFLTLDDNPDAENAPKIKGRIVTTLPKAKEIRPMVEKCITIAKRALPSIENAAPFATSARRGSDEWKAWRKSDQHARWVAARTPLVNAKRRLFTMLRSKRAVELLFDVVAPRFVDRAGGYTRIARLAKPRLGDAGIRAILELVGENDRVKKVAQKPAFES
jgi:large subunit ribosomal protein L17